ncbi:hypothetical protein ABT300_43180 [Streptomyces sp. NPDC001027]|uniref:hypothetical protein n=1 Tax=Streptomyces sp. NPDC001027 TaxID=3154771 RepID=UPI00332B23D1
MGDHSTAFIVQESAVLRRLVGFTAADAARSLADLYTECTRLPGFKLVGGVPDRQRSRLAEADAEVRTLLRDLTDGGKGVTEEERLPKLQELVSAFLQFRELIPLTTLATNVVGQSSAGKGHGEAKWHEILSAYVAKGCPATGAALAKEAALGLLDAKGAVLVAVETDPHRLARLAPGIDPALTSDQRLAAVLVQHVRSVELGYPGTFAGAWPGRNEGEIVADMAQPVQVLLAARQQADIAYYLGRISAVDEQLRALDCAARGSDGALTKADQTTWDKALAWRDHFAAVVTANKGAVPPAPTVTSHKDVLNATRPSRNRKPAKPPFDPSQSSARTTNSTTTSTTTTNSSSSSSSSASKKDDMEVEGAPKQAKAETEENPAALGSLAAQIILRGGAIDDMLSEGRPKKHFHGSMGAHTTAWTAHIDAIRACILGKSVAQAIRDLGVLKDETMATRPALEDAAFAFPAERQIALMSAQEVLVREFEQAERARSETAPLLLQRCITSLLVYTECLPGATLEAADTNGRGEGAARAALLAYEAGCAKGAPTLSRAEVGTQVMTLLDLSSRAEKNITDKQKHTLLENHMRVIRRAYPYAAHAIGWSKPS